MASAVTVPPDKLAERLGGRLAVLRRDRRLTQSGLAALAGLSTRYVAAIEAGKALPSLRTVARLAEDLGVPIAALFAFEDGENAMRSPGRPRKHL